MPKKPRGEQAELKISRRGAFAAAGVCLAMLSQKVRAAMDMAPTSAAPPAEGKATYAKESEAEGMIEVAGIHAGKGTGKIKLFRFGGAPAPAHFIIYDLPPGASEGVHTHFLDDRNKEGSFDEYYYFMSGRGRMEIDGKMVQVARGDHIHTPLEVAHGVENTHPTENLRVFLTFIKRGNEPAPRRRASP